MITKKKADTLSARILDPVAALALLKSELAGQAESPEPGYLRRAEWSEAWGVSKSRTQELLAAGIKAGKVKVKLFRINTGSRFDKVRHYKVE